MSLPAFIRNRRIKSPVEYVSRFLSAEGNPIDQATLHRIFQLKKQWRDDYEGYYINPAKLFTRPYWLTPKDPTEQEIVLAAAGAAGDRVREVEYFVDNQGHMEIASSMFTATSNNFVVEIFDPNRRLILSNREIHARNIGGTGRRQFRWPESYFLNVEEAPRSIVVSFRNLSDEENTIRWVFHGRRWFHKEADAETRKAFWERWAHMEKTFTYFLTNEADPPGGLVPDVILPAGGQLRENQAPVFKSTSEVDTEVIKLTMFAYTEDQSPPLFDFALRLGRSGRILATNPVDYRDGWGDGEFEFVLAESLLVERAKDLRLELINRQAKETTIFPCLVCRRLQYA